MRYTVIISLLLAACNSASDSAGETDIVPENVYNRTPSEKALDACVEKASDPEKDCARELASDDAAIRKRYAKSDAEIDAISREMERRSKCIQANLSKELENDQLEILEARAKCDLK